MRYLSENQFDVYEEIGKGGFGIVYRGLDKVTKKQVAIKQIDLEQNDDLISIQKEIGILSQCQHNNITEYIGSFVRNYKLWIVMEFVDGGSCLDLMKPGPLNEKYIAIILRETLNALTYLHRNSRIHRDIKAANILLSSTGCVKLADFGVSTQLSNNMSKRHTFVGSPYWMSPEVILEDDYNFKADIWSLGITAIELAKGTPPLSKLPPMRVLFKIPAQSPPYLKDDDDEEEEEENPRTYSFQFKDFVKKCLVKNPNERPSANKLLKHPFIKQAGNFEDLSDLIIRKNFWLKTNQENKITRYYIPTINDNNNNNNNDEIEQKKIDDIQFEFDTIVKTSTLPLQNFNEDPFVVSKKTSQDLGNLTLSGASTIKVPKRQRNPKKITSLVTPINTPINSSKDSTRFKTKLSLIFDQINEELDNDLTEKDGHILSTIKSQLFELNEANLKRFVNLFAEAVSSSNDASQRSKPSKNHTPTKTTHEKDEEIKSTILSTPTKNRRRSSSSSQQENLNSMTPRLKNRMIMATPSKRIITNNGSSTPGMRTRIQFSPSKPRISTSSITGGVPFPDLKRRESDRQLLAHNWDNL